MLEELQRRNFSEHTIRYYIRTVEDFARHFNRPPDRLGPRHIREYQAELFQKRKLSPGTVAIRLAALRFFYIKTLKKRDRKSTRLNSSHGYISYAVFCLKKKNMKRSRSSSPETSHSRRRHSTL